MMSPDTTQATPHFIEPNDAIRLAAREVVLQEIEAIGRSRKQSLSDAEDELERLAAFLSVATAAGIRQNEIAERAGVSRQTLVNLRNEGRGGGHEGSLDLQAMVVLASQGPQTVASLTSSLPAVLGDEQLAEAALQRLVEAGAAAWAGAAMSGESRLDYFRLTGQGVEELPGRLRQAAIPDNKRWTAYVATTSLRDAERLAEIAQSILGEYRAGVIPANTMKGMDRPEVAFEVEAPGFGDAISRAAEFYEQLRDKAGLKAEAPRVTAVVPPHARTRASDQLSRGATGPGMADFERLRSDVEAELPPTSSASQTSTQDIAHLAERAPAAAIIQAHMRIEEKLREALISVGEHPSKSDDASALASQALKHRLVSPETVNAVEGATVMRNLAVHGPRRDISVKQAKEYVVIADAVLYTIRQNVSRGASESGE
jgi:transcriptional regulator with XRE-family HTH domain